MSLTFTSLFIKEQCYVYLAFRSGKFERRIALLQGTKVVKGQSSMNYAFLYLLNVPLDKRDNVIQSLTG